MGVAFEEKVLRAEEGIKRALAAKEEILAPAARRIVLKGFRPARGGKVLESKIPGYKPLDKGNARAYEEAARRLLEKGVLEEVVMAPGNRGLIAHVAASRSQARKIPPKGERMGPAASSDKAGKVDALLLRLGDEYPRPFPQERTCIINEAIHALQLERKAYRDARRIIKKPYFAPPCEAAATRNKK